MGKFSFLVLLSFFLVLSVKAGILTWTHTPSTTVFSNENKEKDKSAKIESGDEEKSENEDTNKPEKFILIQLSKIRFLKQSKLINLNKNKNNLPAPYSKVLQQPPEFFLFSE